MAPPLAARFPVPAELEPARAGALFAATVELENAGTLAWASDGMWGIQVAYHWLDDRGNPIVWDGLRTQLAAPVAPGGSARLRLGVRAPMPPGRYRLAIDLIDEGRHWFAELGNEPLERDVEVLPRIERRALFVRLGPGEPGAAAETRAALAAQDEPPCEGEGEAAAIAHLVPGCLPAADWSRRVLDAHAEGYAAVGGSVEPAGGPLARRAAAKAHAAWAPGPGRVPGFPGPLLCPSLVRGLEPAWADPVAGLPALEPPTDEPWVYDGRIALRLRAG
jgi:hypothetical protein